MTDHPQVHVTIDGEDTEVDEDIAELITLINEAGIHTIMSCQDNPGTRQPRPRRVWVDIYADQLAEFLEILNRPEELDDLESLSNRMAPEFVPDDDWEAYDRDRAWHYDLDIARIDGELSDPDVGIRFPYTDLGEVVARLRAAVKGDRGEG